MDSTIRLWHVETGNLIRILQGHSFDVLSIVFNPNNNTLASGSDDHTVRVWDVNTGECLQILNEHTSAASELEIRVGNCFWIGEGV